MRPQFPNNFASLYTFPRECLTCTRKVCIGWSAVSTVQLSILILDTEAFIYFTNNLPATTASSPLSMFDLGPKTCIAYTFTSDVRASWKILVSFTNPTNLRFSGICKHTFEEAKVPARISGTTSLALQSLGNRSVILSTDSCSGLGIIPFPDLLLVALTGSSSGRRDMSLISFTHHGYCLTILQCSRSTIYMRGTLDAAADSQV